MIASFLHETLRLYLDAAPWLLLGLVAAGLIKAWVPDDWLGSRLGGPGPGPVLKAALVGAPLPLCSCGVLPAALGLRRGGASQGATVSFLVSTPETGVDSVAVSYALLGPFMALVRPLAALASALLTGGLAAMVPTAPVAAAAVETSSCGCSCSGGCGAPAPTPGPLARTLGGVRYALTDILDDIALWLGVGLLLAGAVAAWVPPQALAEWGGGPLAMGVMLLVGVPMYICATASTPLAAALLLAGVSPGAVLVFLLAGPATNVATVAVIGRELGRRVLGAYLLGIAVSSIALGLATNAAVRALDINVAAQLHAGGEAVPHVVAIACGVVLAVAAVRPLRRRLLR